MPRQPKTAAPSGGRLVLSFCFFGRWVFKGVKVGTIVCALINGAIIGLCSRFFDRFFEFRDALKLRKYF